MFWRLKTQNFLGLGPGPLWGDLQHPPPPFFFLSAFQTQTYALFRLGRFRFFFSSSTLMPDICSSKQMGHVMSCQMGGRTTVMFFSMHFCLSCQQSFLPQLPICELSSGSDIFLSIHPNPLTIHCMMVGCLTKFGLILI